MTANLISHVVRHAWDGDRLIAPFRADVGRYLTEHWYEADALQVIEVFQSGDTTETVQRKWTARDWYGRNHA